MRLEAPVASGPPAGQQQNGAAAAAVAAAAAALAGPVSAPPAFRAAAAEPSPELSRASEPEDKSLGGKFLYATKVSGCKKLLTLIHPFYRYRSVVLLRVGECSIPRVQQDYRDWKT